MSTAIQWTDRSANPLLAWRKVNGKWKLGWWCVKKSAGCGHCYACFMNCMPAALASTKRRGNGADYIMRAVADVEPHLDEALLGKMLRWRGPYRVFPCDMTDAFLSVIACRKCGWAKELEERPWLHECPSCRSTNLKRFWPSDWIQKILDVYDAMARKGHTIQSLTKRTRRMLGELSKWKARHGRKLDAGVWLGFSAERQAELDERWADMREAHRYADGLTWVSFEPGLGRTDFTAPLAEGLGWGVIGGESGTLARPFDLDWAFDGVAQFVQHERRVFVKQLGARIFLPDGMRPVIGMEGDPQSWGNTWKPTDPATGQTPKGWPERPLWKTGDRKGGNMDHWPMGLRRREFPERIAE